ncbi:hypothetical protein [Rhizobium sp. Root149]|uniref:hypothetical protein n=1 Tax=Rhizobium sp. Root149 TaxID=1736473 RepID=UPI0012E3B17C|nr:hypothetical protein [Rhizobium sp. Root149]
MDKSAFVEFGYSVTPTSNGGIIAKPFGGNADQLNWVSFTTPAEFIEWLKGEYGVKDAPHEIYRPDKFLEQVGKKLAQRPSGRAAGDRQFAGGATYILREYHLGSDDNQTPFWRWEHEACLRT